MITTNVNLNDSKSSILLELSKLVATSTGKPESYVAISITDNASMVFGGSDAPLALGVMYSLGSIKKRIIVKFRLVLRIFWKSLVLPRIGYICEYLICVTCFFLCYSFLQYEEHMLTIYNTAISSICQGSVLVGIGGRLLDKRLRNGNCWPVK